MCVFRTKLLQHLPEISLWRTLSFGLCKFSLCVHCYSMICTKLPSCLVFSEMSWVRLSNGEVARTKLKTRKGDEPADSRRNENIIPNGTSHHEKVSDRVLFKCEHASTKDLGNNN